MIQTWRLVKFWLAICLFSMLLWVVYWFRPSYEHFFNAIYGVPDSYVSNLGVVYWSGHFGLNARFLCSIFGLAGLALCWSAAVVVRKVRFLFGAACFCEGLYFVLLTPFVWNLANRGMVFFTWSYIIQIVAAAPILLLLALKLFRFTGVNADRLWVWVGLGSFGYVVALWANAVLRWFDMVSVEGWAFFSGGVRVWGFMNALVLMSAAVVFAAIGLMFFYRKNKFSALKWLGLSLAAVGLQYCLYAVYSAYVNALSYTLLIDIWTMPFLGLSLGA